MYQIFILLTSMTDEYDAYSSSMACVISLFLVHFHNVNVCASRCRCDTYIQLFAGGHDAKHSEPTPAAAACLVPRVQMLSSALLF